jgi:hypothetical protein
MIAGHKRSQQITVITEPNHVDKALFKSFVAVYQDLFPDPLTRADPTLVEDWIEQDYLGDNATWAELLVVSHVDHEVTSTITVQFRSPTGAI